MVIAGSAFLGVGPRWGQVVFAPLMMSLSFSVGVCPFKTRRGRRLRRSWMAWTWVLVMVVKLVPLGSVRGSGGWCAWQGQVVEPPLVGGVLPVWGWSWSASVSGGGGW